MSQGQPAGGKSGQRPADDRSSDSQIFTGSTDGGEQAAKPNHGGQTETKQAPVGKAKAGGGSKVTEASQSAKDQYNYMIQQL